MKEICFSRFLWAGITGILLILSFANVNFKEDKRSCTITQITYPYDFDSNVGWVFCPCFTDFCTLVCYCVNLISDNGYIYKEPSDTECTFKSNIIPFKLNFSNILDKYLNQTIDCWYDRKYDNYYIENSYAKNYSKNIFLSILGIFTFLCVVLEIVNYNCYSEKTIGEQEHYEIPRYDSESPPSYEDQENI